MNEREKLLQENTELIMQLIKETLAYYNSTACPCAFPRFYQYSSIDCVDHRGSFYFSETEGFIYHAKEYYDIVQSGGNNATYTCKKCASTFEYGWEDFSILVSRSYLKPIELKAKIVGAEMKQPIPFFVGPSGHKMPERSLFQLVTLEEFKAYLWELQNGK